METVEDFQSADNTVSHPPDQGLDNLRERFEQIAADEIERLFETVPKAREFHRGTWIDREYYRRHLLETILRIRLNNEVDAYALHKIGAKDNVLAARLARYLAEEYGHENMFMRDLAHYGISKEQADSIQPYESTKQLIGYMYLAINQDGPLPTMVWNWFVEWYSDNYNKTITLHAAKTFGEETTRGSKSHIDYDESHNHDDLMWSTVQRAIRGWGDERLAETYLRNFVRQIAQYFQELYDTTVARNTDRAKST